ncbi:MAG TPA: DedA family protein [Longimicrobiaceae bacterium]|jgi:membrane protein DedA with SNARE-associated domain|nr:DedA family protein [Longimicrobiaceae bacterium]
MGHAIDALLHWMEALPAAVVYLVVGAFAAVENVFPPVPADVIALFGGFLAGQKVVHPVGIFLVTWLCNVGGAMLVYAVGRRYGSGFFKGRFGKAILKPGQLATLSEFYGRHGTKVIFVSRFLPMFRAVVPIFAGTSKLGVWRTLLPLAAASGLWYGLIVYLGATAGRNWEHIRAGLESSGRWLFIAALVLLAGVVWWWWKSRRREA